MARQTHEDASGSVYARAFMRASVSMTWQCRQEAQQIVARALHGWEWAINTPIVAGTHMVNDTYAIHVCVDPTEGHNRAIARRRARTAATGRRPSLRQFDRTAFK